MTVVHTIEYVELKAIKPDPGNPRTHSKKQVQQIAESIRHFRYINPVLVGAKSGEIICGHGRFRAAQLLGWETIPVISISGLSEAEARALRIADNKIALNAGWDPDLLRVSLGEIQLASLDLELTGFSVGQIDVSLVPKPCPDNDAIPPVPLMPVTRTGDIWICGEHRTGCGDLLDGTSLAAVRAGELADALISDPPYNVPINGFANARGRHREFAMASGEMSEQEFRAFIAARFPHQTLLRSIGRCRSSNFCSVGQRDLRVRLFGAANFFKRYCRNCRQRIAGRFSLLMDKWRTSAVDPRPQNGALPRRSRVNKLLNKVSDLIVAEREGFEPSIRFCRILTFQASAFDHSATAPHRWKIGDLGSAAPAGKVAANHRRP
jgi:hypothetical protein